MRRAAGGEDGFRRAAAWTAILAAGVGSLSGVLLLLASAEVIGRVGILEFVERQSLLLQAGPSKAELLRWAYLTDLLGYYLLLLPFIIALEGRTAPAVGRGAARLATVCGVLYVGIGSTGAVLLATLGPELLRAAGSDGGTAAAMFQALFEGVHRGLWQTVDPILVGVWLLISGVAYRRLGKPVLGWGGMVFGAAGLVAAFGWFIDSPVVVLAGLSVLLAVVVWIVAAALDLLRSGREPAV